MIRAWFIGVLVTLGTCLAAFAQTQDDLELRVVAEGLTIPWDLVWGPDHHVWIMERTGRISRLNPDTRELQEIHQLTDVYQSWDNSGAHALLLHPEFPIQPYLYVNYTHAEFASRLVRLEFSVRTQTVVDTTHILSSIPGNSSHNGSRLEVGPDGYLYFCTGDGYMAQRAQDLDLLPGKVLRMDLDGNPAPGNPFGNRVWSLGHRNPQGLAFGRNGQLYLSEHGPATDDEVNRIVPGGNYGWPFVHGACDLPNELAFCAEENVVEPLAAWTPTEAPSGMAYFDVPSIPSWQNALLLCFLKGQTLRILHLNDAGDAIESEESWYHEELGRLRDVLVTPEGRVFLATSNREINGWQYLAQPTDDRIFEIVNPLHAYEVPAPFVVDGAMTQEATVFPQPAHETLRVLIDPADTRVDVRLHSMAGRVVREVRGQAIVFAGLLDVDVTGLLPGMYVLEVRGDSGAVRAARVLVQ
jgi:glucose/arabinose dehydrogenase